MRLLGSTPPPLLVTREPAGPVLKLGPFWPVKTKVFARSQGAGAGDPSGYLSPSKNGVGVSWFSTHVAVSFPILLPGMTALGMTASRCGKVTNRKVKL